MPKTIELVFNQHLIIIEALERYAKDAMDITPAQAWRAGQLAYNIREQIREQIKEKANGTRMPEPAVHNEP